jgi:predicted MPP superfamily phosphohydrolase
MLSRRQFLHSVVAGSALAASGFALRDLYANSYTSDFVVERVHHRITGLPSAFSGYRIGFLTDVHLSTWVPQEWIERALAVFQEEEIDLLILGGDYILVQDLSLWNQLGLIRNPRFAGMKKRDAIPAIYSAFAQCISKFSCRDGIVGVVGNHEHWNRFPIFQSILREHPTIRILVNEETVIRRGEQELVLWGVDDYLTGLPAAPPPRTLSDGVAKRIIISHNPDYLAAIIREPAHHFSLALCGHTHGGQIVVPGLGPLAAQVVDRRFIAGLQRLDDHRAVYTSRGLGVVALPFRINCPAEVTILTLATA